MGRILFAILIVALSAGAGRAQTKVFSAQTATTYTIQPADCGTVIRITNAHTITVTLPNNIGVSSTFLCEVGIIQAGSGKVLFVPASGATLSSVFNYTATGGQNSRVDLGVYRNNGGTAARWTLYGDGATSAPPAVFHKGLGDAQLLTSGGGLNARLDDYVTLGVKWYRFEFDWSLIQPINAQLFSTLTTLDSVVQGLNDRGIRILGLLAYTPEWANGGAGTKYKPPVSVSQFATYAAAMATRYAPLGIHDWEIWNEPNLAQFWVGGANAANYTALLQAAYTAIKAVDPTANVVSAGLSQPVTGGGNIDMRTYLNGMYTAGAHGFFDALGDHPYCHEPFPCDNVKKIYDPLFAPTVLDIMTSNGDGSKLVWITEWGCATAGTGAECSTTTQATAVTDMFAYLNTAAWAGPGFWYNYQDFCSPGNPDPQCYYGIINLDGSHKPAWATFQAATP